MDQIDMLAIIHAIDSPRVPDQPAQRTKHPIPNGRILDTLRCFSIGIAHDLSMRQPGRRIFITTSSAPPSPIRRSNRSLCPLIVEISACPPSDSFFAGFVLDPAT